jgi:hypothetical protein
MKRLFLPLLFALPFTVTAQLANPGFEEWFHEPESFVNRPLGWTWSDGTTTDPNHWFFAPFADNAHSGDFALTLHALFDSKDMALQHAPIAGRPTHFKGHYNYTWNTILAPDSTPVTDIAQITVFLTRWDADSSQRDTVGFGILDLGTSVTYTEFDLSLNYLSPEDPDSVFVFLDPSMMGRIPQVQFTQPDGPGSFFTVDDLQFTGGSLGVNEPDGQTISIYPNPATDKVYFGDFTGTVSVSDASGRVVIDRQSVTPGAGININNLPVGPYFLELTAKEAVFHSPIIKQ